MSGKVDVRWFTDHWLQDVAINVLEDYLSVIPVSPIDGQANILVGVVSERRARGNVIALLFNIRL